MKNDTDVAIVGAGIGGLVLALSLNQAGIGCRVFEAVTEIKPLGAGINLLPHAVRELDDLGLLPRLDAVGIRTKDASYYNRYGQFIYRELAGIGAGYDWPQFSIHRGDVQMLLLDAIRQGLGKDAVVTGHRCVSVATESGRVEVRFKNSAGEDVPPVRAAICVGCDGIHSTIRKQYYPNEGDPVYAGITTWRGVTPFKPFLGGANTVRIGWMPVGKLMVYPIRNNIDAEGNQLMNFVASLERPVPPVWDWNREAKLEDFFAPFADWHFDWLDAAELLRKTKPILVFPMVDRDPVPTWTFGRTTLLGDAAHPMYSRGSNGAGQAILDARYLTGAFKRHGLNEKALADYDRVRVKATGDVVLMNRANPPDAILREVYTRTHDKPFKNIDDVISPAELHRISDNYKVVAGFEKERLRARASYV
jgi:2-polyprenyl-6-methoxyphenol hydroxylase-like FAD-dependent oxidoreductase